MVEDVEDEAMPCEVLPWFWGHPAEVCKSYSRGICERELSPREQEIEDMANKGLI